MMQTIWDSVVTTPIHDDDETIRRQDEILLRGHLKLVNIAMGPGMLIYMELDELTCHMEVVDYLVRPIYYSPLGKASEDANESEVLFPAPASYLRQLSRSSTLHPTYISSPHCAQM